MRHDPVDVALASEQVPDELEQDLVRRVQINQERICLMGGSDQVCPDPCSGRLDKQGEKAPTAKQRLTHVLWCVAFQVNDLGLALILEAVEQNALQNAHCAF